MLRFPFLPTLRSTVCLGLLFSAVEARAIGLREVTLPPIPPAAQQIAVDGELGEWKSVAGVNYNPLDKVVASGGDAAVEELLANPVTANFKACYDAEALYVSVEWKDRNPGKNKSRDASRWFDGGEGFELHLRTDRVLHLACWPSARGRKLHVMARYGDDREWRDISKAVAAAGGIAGKEKGYGQELRIPWSTLTASGKIPADGKLELGIDFAWNAMSSSFVENIRKAMASTDALIFTVTSSFLTSRPTLAGAGYLPNPADWGELAIGESAGNLEPVKSAEGNTSLSVLPVPLKESDWQPLQSARYLSALWGSRYVCQVAARYDAEKLYFKAHFASPGPVNWKAKVTQQGFLGGDALQIRLSNGGKKINLCGWYDSNARESVLVTDQKDLASPFLLEQGATQSFQADPSGGYIQELAVPWKLLFGGAPKSGEKIKATLQFWYADLGPRFSLHGRTTLERQGALAVDYEMPADGQLTLGLYGKDGQLLKWLVRDEFRSAGKNRQMWDGLDQWRNQVSAGAYDLKAIYHAPITTDYLTSVCNPGNPPWPTPDDKGDWLGDEANPQAAVTDGKWVFLAAPGCELGYSIMAVDENGRRQWGVREMFSPRCVSMTLDGNYLYALFSGPERIGSGPNVFTGKNAVERAILVCLDKRTGAPALFTKDDPKLKVAQWPYREEVSWLAELRNSKSFTPANYGGQPRYFCIDVGESTNAIGIASAGGKLYVSMIYDNKLLVLDAATGKPTGEEIALNAPAGLYAPDAKTLLAVSGKQVVKIDLASKRVTPFIGSQLLAPACVTTDRQGSVYVSDWGASFQVKVFDASGRFVRAIGKEGGRPWVGKWESDGMLVPRGIAVTDEGKLWVTEDDGSPKRISVWNSKSGALVKDYIGPAPYGGGTFFWIDPKDPALVHTEGTRFKVDYSAKTHPPESIVFRRQGRDDPFTPVGHNLNDVQVRVLYREGKEYLFVSNVQRNTMALLQRQGDIYRAVAGFGGIVKQQGPMPNDGTGVVEWDSDIGYHLYLGFFPECFKGHQGDNYSWADSNGDFLVQPEEMRWLTPLEGNGQGSMERLWNADLGADWSFYFVGKIKDKQGVYRLSPRSWTDAGAPLYDIADAKLVFTEPGSYMINSLHVTPDEKLIVCFNYEQWGNSPETVACYSLEGKRLWSIARTDPWVEPSPQSTMVHANGAIYDFHIPKLGHVFGTWLYHGNKRPYLITTDGLYVGTMLEDTMLGPTSLRGESACYYYQAPDGTPCIINGANQAEHIFKINGLESGSVGRFEGGFQLSEADVRKAAEMRAVPETVAAPKPAIGINWLKESPAIDGNLGEWNLNNGVSLDGGNGRSAEVTLGRDEQNLYLAYKVRERQPMRNGGADWQSLFITGDCVDLMLQTDPKADPKRRAAVAGDQRILFTLFQDKPIAVLYRPVVPGTASPILLASAQIDQVIKLDSAKVAITRDAEHGVYSVEASVPLKDLGIDAKETGALRGDVGVIFADETGKGRSLRLYYYNKKTQMVNDLATEATLQPAEWGQISMPLGPNLVRNGGFEEPLVASREEANQGWFVSTAANGSEAAESEESPFTGRRSLLLQTSVPVTFPDAAYADPDYSRFIKSANGGKGGGDAVVIQKVPVIAGHEYSLRYRYRSEGMLTERRQPGKPRGYVAFRARLDWLCTPPHKAPGIGVGLQGNSMTEWQTVQDFYNQPWLFNKTYLAPEGATGALLAFQLTTLAADHTPKLFLDNVEFVDLSARSGATVN